MITFMLVIKGFYEVGRFDDAKGLMRSMEAHGESMKVSIYEIYGRNESMRDPTKLDAASLSLLTPAMDINDLWTGDTIISVLYESRKDLVQRHNPDWVSFQEAMMYLLSFEEETMRIKFKLCHSK
ncbi:hypothetical protein QJS10_CPA08g00188 [Acorus calamus]|uniref:Pentatricopeptide repeat-containing protein n=1 Tax=Acorus calamus TaxID=4465 RepID=A0AAV9EC69_ACOCL|nr:hypothetical protein QJS10_CPA08g00188 [Acorus calamus]